MRVKYHLWPVVLIRLNCGAEKNIHSLVTFVLGDRLSGVTVTLQLVNLDGARRAPRLQPGCQGASPGARHSWCFLPAPLLASREGAGEQGVHTGAEAPPYAWPRLSGSGKVAYWRRLSWRGMTSVSALGCREVLDIFKKTKLKKEKTKEKNPPTQAKSSLGGYRFVAVGSGNSPCSPFVGVGGGMWCGSARALKINDSAVGSTW